MGDPIALVSTSRGVAVIGSTQSVVAIGGDGDRTAVSPAPKGRVAIGAIAGVVAVSPGGGAGSGGGEVMPKVIPVTSAGPVVLDPVDKWVRVLIEYTGGPITVQFPGTPPANYTVEVKGSRGVGFDAQGNLITCDLAGKTLRDTGETGLDIDIDGVALMLVWDGSEYELWEL